MSDSNNITTIKETEENIAALNIIKNDDFSDGLCSWTSNCCDAFVVISVDSNLESYVVVSNRSKTWQGLEQVITDRVSPGCLYKVSASVSVLGPVQGSMQVLATLRLEQKNSATKYQRIGRTYASKDTWKILEGTFVLSKIPDRVVFYLEGPPPGIDLLVKSVTIHRESDNKLERSREFCPAPKASHQREEDIGISNVEANHDDWVKLPAKKKTPSGQPHMESNAIGMSIVSNSHLSDNTIEVDHGWVLLHGAGTSSS